MIPTDSKCENIIDKYTDIEIDSLINIIYYSILDSNIIHLDLDLSSTHLIIPFTTLDLSGSSVSWSRECKQRGPRTSVLWELVQPSVVLGILLSSPLRPY